MVEPPQSRASTVNLPFAMVYATSTRSIG